MFWDTVVMAEAVKLAVEHVGPMGQYLEKPEYANVGLYTHEAGKFWYGDIGLSSVRGLKEVAKAMKETVYVIPEMGISDDRPLHQQALTEVTP